MSSVELVVMVSQRLLKLYMQGLALIWVELLQPVTWPETVSSETDPQAINSAVHQELEELQARPNPNSTANTPA